MTFLKFLGPNNAPVWIVLEAIVGVLAVERPSPPFRGSRIITRGGLFDVQGSPHQILHVIGTALQVPGLQDVDEVEQPTGDSPS